MGQSAPVPHVVEPVHIGQEKGVQDSHGAYAPQAQNRHADQGIEDIAAQHHCRQHQAVDQQEHGGQCGQGQGRGPEEPAHVLPACAQLSQKACRQGQGGQVEHNEGQEPEQEAIQEAGREQGVPLHGQAVVGIHHVFMEDEAEAEESRYDGPGNGHYPSCHGDVFPEKGHRLPNQVFPAVHPAEEGPLCRQPLDVRLVAAPDQPCHGQHQEAPQGGQSQHPDFMPQVFPHDLKKEVL